MGTSTYATIACLHCDDDAIRSLQIILPMLKSYLGHDWTVDASNPRQAALRVVNLDHPEGAGILASLGPNAVGCSVHPRQHAPGTIHFRPFRGYELLSVLKEIERTGMGGEAREQATAAHALEEDRSRSFKLAYWPDEFEQWPRDWWRILASLRQRRLSTAALAQQLNLPPETVAECLDRLLRIHAVTVEFDRNAIVEPRLETGLWSKLSTRIVGLLRASG
jgi:hypothetical protein